MRDLKYAVIGAGAMGAYVTRFAAKAGREVWFVDPFEAHMKAIEEKGLIIYDSFDEQSDIAPEIIRGIHTSTRPEPVGRADVIVLMVKTLYTRSAVDNIKAIAKEDSIILTLQNGIGNVDILEEFFPKENIAYGCILAGSWLEKPGVIRGGGSCGVSFGSDYKKYWDKLKLIEEDMNAGGGQYVLEEDFKKHVWAKVAVNCANNALTGIVHLDLNGLASNAHGVETSRAIMAEVQAVARAKGVELKDEELMWLEPRPWNGVRSHRPTTYQDFLAKRKTEIEFLNGAIAREGEKLGIPTPYNMVIAQLTRIIEETYDIRDA